MLAKMNVPCAVKCGRECDLGGIVLMPLRYPLLEDMICRMSTHTSHPEVIKRLKRAEGHLKSIITMLQEGRGCLDVAQQMQAVESAVSNAKKTLVHDHIDHCLEHAVRERTQGNDDTIREFKAITKYL